MSTAATVLAVLVGVHVLVKFAFFALPYPRRRAQLDRSYAGRLSATHAADAASLVVVVALVAVLLGAGLAPVSFLIGLWCGATLVQVYFHRFWQPLPADRAPTGPAGPIRVMSYAIQADPWRAWREVVLLAVLVIVALVLLVV